MKELESKKLLKFKKGEQVGMIADTYYMTTENGDTHEKFLKPGEANE